MLAIWEFFWVTPWPEPIAIQPLSGSGTVFQYQGSGQVQDGNQASGVIAEGNYGTGIVEG